MHWYKTFFANICILFALTYLASLFNKYILLGFCRRTKTLLFALAAVGAGWVSMFFGLPLAEQVRFDLRFVPLIIAPMFVGPSYWLILIGAGIGLTRLTFSLSPASWVGCMNMVILGLLAAAIHEWVKRKPFGFWRKNLCFVLAINVMNVIVIAIFGVIPAWDYLLRIAPLTFPISVLLSAFFSLLLRDFHMEYRRQEHLRDANRELAVQYEIAQDKTAELVKTTAALEEHARMLQLSNRYKSEFLANMSHELRTPLGSMLILSQLLAENRNGALPPEEVSYAEMIYSSGNDLLHLINDILDLSKVEAGRLDIVREAVNLNELPQILERNFRPLAQQKGLVFELTFEPGLPDIIYTDGQRLHQILMNLLSNAFKFTEKGSVAISVRRTSREEVARAFRIQSDRMPDGLPEMGFFGSSFETYPNSFAGASAHPRGGGPGASEPSDPPLTQSPPGSPGVPGASVSPVSPVSPDSQDSQEASASSAHPGGQGLPEWIAFSVKDTGIGIPEDKHSFVFEAFRQADGTTSRKYGGTGLGLSISREFAKLLGGFILLDSVMERGSQFTLYLPYGTEQPE